jgi:chitinase
MTQPHHRLIAAVTLAASLLAIPALADPAPPAKRLVGFYASWSAYGPFKVAQIPAERLTHVAYAFATVSPKGLLALGDPDIDPANIADLATLKRRYPHLAVMLAVGGAGSGSKHFSAMVRTAASRQRFAESCATLLARYRSSFDGLTIDWEYPQGDGQGVPGVKEDRERFTALLGQLRTVLDTQGRKQGRHLQLAAALPAGQAQLKRFELPKVAGSLDFIDFMSFDYATGSGRTGHNAPLQAATPTAESVERSVQSLLAAGVPAAKIDLALPFFGRSWRQVPLGSSNGLGQPGKTDNLDTEYRALAKSALKGGYQSHWDAKAAAPFLTGGKEQRWISYDDARSLTAKGTFVRTHNLGGAFIWHLGADDPAGTLLKAAWQSLQGLH